MSRGAGWGRWMALLLVVLAPIAAAVAYACMRWGQTAIEAVQVAIKMVVIP